MSFSFNNRDLSRWIIFVISLSCNNESSTRNSERSWPDKVSQNPSPISYADDIKPIMDQYCISCHNPNNIAAAPLPQTDYTSYNGVMPYGQLIEENQEFKSLSEENQAVIKIWIDGGLKDDNTFALAYEVIEEHCISCHSSEAPLRVPLPTTDLTQESVVRAVAAELPPFGRLKKLPQEQQDTLEKWVREVTK
tara:strand:+ start:290 stop:868 length:579 start_codon:yes stop_codon:yes gene_type:complete